MEPVTEVERHLFAAAKMMSDEADHLRDDALAYAGSATWEMWENHVPQILVALWLQLSPQARLAVFITAKQFTTYNARSGSA